MGGANVPSLQRVDIESAGKAPIFEVPRAFIDYWRRVHADHFPTRADFDPTTIDPRFVSRMAILEAIDGGRDFRYRLFATRRVDAYGRDLTGAFLSDLIDENPVSADLIRVYRSVIRAGLPTCLLVSYWSEDEALQRAATAVVPVRTVDGASEVVLCSEGLDPIAFP